MKNILSFKLYKLSKDSGSKFNFKNKISIFRQTKKNPKKNNNKRLRALENKRKRITMNDAIFCRDP